MTGVVNLNKARKARDRKEAEAKAAQNRVRFGRTKGEKAAERLEAERSRRAVDEARRET